MCRRLLSRANASSSPVCRSWNLPKGWRDWQTGLNHACNGIQLAASTALKYSRMHCDGGHAFVLQSSTRSVSTMMTNDPQRRISSDYLTCQDKDPNLIVIVLNWELSPLTTRLWKSASLRICADGGANRLYDQALAWHPELDATTARSSYAPDIIKGDLDSIRDEVKDFYLNCGVRIIDMSEDQDSTDLEKCLHCATKSVEERGGLDSATVIALGGLGGRLDHTLSNLNLLYKMPNLRLVLCGDGNLAELIPAGTTVLEVDPAIQGPACGLVSLAAPAKVTTRGLVWDCDAIILEVGGMQSTSNKIKDRQISVATDQPLIWTVEFQDTSAPIL
eukprot:jgi/Botrbrau1/19651/Bobra.0003s0017.2